VRRILSYAKLTRPQNNLITALSVLVGATISASVDSWDKVSLACLSAFLISAGGNSINDFFDVKIDRINKPKRPLPRGKISLSSALVFSVALFLFGVALSFWIKPVNIGLAVFACGLLIIYSSTLKKRFLLGNLTVSLVSSLAFIYGGMVTDDFRLSLIPAALAFLFHLGREILKDLEDREGDLSSGASTLPIVLGAKFSLLFCSFIFITLLVLTLLPYILNIFSFAYLVLVLGVDLVLVYVMWSMWKNGSRENLHRLSSILKADMLLGLAAIFLGRF
jgi:geranylgeranylglycerol-phosphate geranylgeranyltransferase